MQPPPSGFPTDLADARQPSRLPYPFGQGPRNRRRSISHSTHKHQILAAPTAPYSANNAGVSPKYRLYLSIILQVLNINLTIDLGKSLTLTIFNILLKHYFPYIVIFIKLFHGQSDNNPKIPQFLFRFYVQFLLILTIRHV